MSKKIQLSKGMINHVSICRFPRRAFLCLACLLAFEVVADFTDIDSLHLQYITDDVNIIGEYDDQILRILLGVNQNQGITSSYNNDFSYNPTYKISNTSMINALNIIKQQMASPTYQNRVGNDYYATLYGLIAGWSPNSIPNVDGIPYGVETNGIFWFARDLSDSLHNTNSVFHRQLTVQETLTNQLERMLAMNSNYLSHISYQMQFQNWNDTQFYSPSYTEWMQRIKDFPNEYDDAVYTKNYPDSLFYLDWLQIGNDWLEPYVYLSTFGGNQNGDDLIYQSEQRYQRYGTKWGFDAVTNILLSQDFDFNSISVVKPEVDDMIDDSTEEVQESLPTAEESKEDGAAPGDYESVQDERIDSGFLDEAKTDYTGIKFDENLFQDFKQKYNGLFQFGNSKSLMYSFEMDTPDGEKITVSDTDLLGDMAQTLSQQKGNVDKIIKVIIGLNKFICLLVFFGRAFQFTNEIFSS